MLSTVKSYSSVNESYRAFLAELSASTSNTFDDDQTDSTQGGFSGDIEQQYASRLAVATDNSIYQQLPEAVVFPRSVHDLVILGNLLARHPSVKVGPRGGGTGTNGQSLTPGIVVDMSRYMRQILEINPEEGWVRVQAGVIKDQLNDALRPHGFFFSPDLSTSNRATIGGMISTDASGQGSLVYGKTSDHILQLTAVLPNGEVIETKPTALSESLSAASPKIQQIVAQIKASCIDKRQAILEKFPRLNRFLTGYDLEHAVSDDLQHYDIARILAGSEGSLAFIAEAKLNLTPIPKARALINIQYDSFESALRHAPVMVDAKATSVETVDSNVLNLAKQDIVWHSVSALIPDLPGKTVLGLNMVEYTGTDRTGLETRIQSLCAVLDRAIEQQHGGVLGYQVTFELSDINKIYGMRKKSVGLLGKTPGAKKPVAFAEDTAVPPENLADFIMEFRALLDSKKLHYGMFGHVDAGVLHVRPALDMCDPQQEQLMQAVSDDVVALVAKYGGLMWGEHGKGYRSEYAPAFFGEELFSELRKIKAAFDPHNQMNPGKICTPIASDEQLVKVSDTKRGFYDRQIPVAVRESWQQAMNCNGNGLCFNYDTRSPMCPSYKVTGDRRHSPKGRAGLMREWLRLTQEQQIDISVLEKDPNPGSFAQKRANTHALKTGKIDDFSQQVFEAMDECLACKACTNQCPVNVSVPDFRARFLRLYYSRYQRPLKDYLVANIEAMAPWLAKLPRLVNWGQSLTWVKTLIKQHIGYVDAPILSVPDLSSRLRASGTHQQFNLAALQQLSDAEKHRSILIVQDPFTSFYEAKVVADLVALADKLGITATVLPFKPNGKPQHVKGFLDEFANTAKNSADFLNHVAKIGIPLVGVDPSMVLCYRDEYQKVLGDQRGNFEVLLVQEWLAKMIDAEQLKALSSTALASTANASRYALLGHCTEKTLLPASGDDWTKVFKHFGLNLASVPVGCCGMAGTYGHETSHLDNSKALFEMSWQPAIAQQDNDTEILATGYSCRSQIQRFSQSTMGGQKPKHPLQALLAALSHSN